MYTNDEIIQLIKQYQHSLEKYCKYENEEKISYYLKKLDKLPITVAHLELTGVGKTVNSVKRFGGRAGDYSKNLVNKWKAIVLEEQENGTGEFL